MSTIIVQVKFSTSTWHELFTYPDTPPGISMIKDLYNSYKKGGHEIRLLRRELVEREISVEELQ